MVAAPSDQGKTFREAAKRQLANGNEVPYIAATLSNR